MSATAKLEAEQAARNALLDARARRELAAYYAKYETELRDRYGDDYEDIVAGLADKDARSIERELTVFVLKGWSL